MRDRNPAGIMLIYRLLLCRAVLDIYVLRIETSESEIIFIFLIFFVYIWPLQTLLVYVSRRDTYEKLI